MHKCIVAKIDKIVDIPGADKIQTAYVLGEQVIVSKDWGEGKVGLLFPEGLQLSEEFCSYNNLYRNSEKNADKSKKGFFEDSRRVRSQPFMKVKSEAFFCELDALVYCGENKYLDLTVGDEFDELNGYKICEKYFSPQTLKKMNHVQKNKTKVVLTPDFHKHVNTDQFKHYVNKINKGDLINIHAKLHGSSGRYSYTKVKNDLPKWKEWLNKVSIKLLGEYIFSKWSYQYLVGTRNVVLYEDQYDKEGFHGNEQWRFDISEQLKPHLDKGMTIYGEICGYANGKPIMAKHDMTVLKNKQYNKKYGKEIVYNYGCKEHEKRFHIYRIEYINESGAVVDFTDQQIKEWCDKRGFNATLNVHPQFVFDGDHEKLQELVEELTERPDVLTEDFIDPSHISEGVIIRVDNGSQTPKFYKNKSYAFKVLEGIAKENDVDLEDAS